MFDKFKDLYQLKKLQNELAKEVIEVASSDSKIKISIALDQKVKEIKIAEDLLGADNKDQLEFALKAIVNSALSQAQQKAAARMKDFGGLAGLLGS